MSPSWQAHLVNGLVRARMRPYALRPIDPLWVRRNMGKPKSARELMARWTGARSEEVAAGRLWTGGERVWLPDTVVATAIARSHATAIARSDAATIARSDAAASPTAHESAPAAHGAPVTLYLHGGGFIACSPSTHRPLVSSLVRRIGGEAWVPRYRLAPEFQFPAAIDDALQSYRFLLEERGVSPSQIVLAGDSAGGGLALALAMRVRDEGLPLPSCLLMFSPWTDLATTGESLNENSDRCAMFAGDTIRRAARFYIGEADPRNPRLSPLYGDFAGLPPLLLHASEDEVLRDDSIRVAERARAANVITSIELWQHVPHVWQFFAAVLPEARDSLARAAHFVEQSMSSAAIANGARPSRNES